MVAIVARAVRRQNTPRYVARDALVDARQASEPIAAAVVCAEVPRRRQILVGLPALLMGAGATAACDAPRPGLVPERGPRRSVRTSPVDRDPVGPLDDVDPALRWAFAEDGFAPLPEAGPGDWLHAHAESPQSFATFTIEGPNRPTAERRTATGLNWNGCAGM